MPDDITCYLTDGVTQIDLPPDRYLDPDIDLINFGLNVESEISGAGTAIVQMSIQTDGLPIACRGLAALSRATVSAIKILFSQGDLLTLRLSGNRVYSVIGIGIELEQPFYYSPPYDEDICFVTLNFITKAA